MMHFQNLRVVDREIDGVTVLRGAELNICDGRGNLYVDGDAMREMDYCIASIHPILYASSDPAENLRAYQGAMEDPRVKILGHPEDGRAPVDFMALAAPPRSGRARRGQQFFAAAHYLPPQYPGKHNRHAARLRSVRDAHLPGHRRALCHRRGPL